MDIKIDPEFRDVIPPLSAEEYAGLEANIIADGCMNALVLWGEILVDGHNRYRICTEHNIPFETVQKDFDSREDVIIWICKNQSGRRNLTPEQLSYLRGKRYEMEKRQRGGDRKSSNQNDYLIMQTRSAIAKECGVGDATIQRDEKFSKAVDALSALSPAVKPYILSGKAGPKSDVIKAANATDEQKREILSRVEDGQTFREAVREAFSPPEDDEPPFEPDEREDEEPEKVISIKEAIAQLKSSDYTEAKYTPEMVISELQAFAQDFLCNVSRYAHDALYTEVYPTMTDQQTEIILESLTDMHDAIREIKNAMKRRKKRSGA